MKQLFISRVFFAIQIRTLLTPWGIWLSVTGKACPNSDLIVTPGIKRLSTQILNSLCEFGKSLWCVILKGKEPSPINHMNAWRQRWCLIDGSCYWLQYRSPSLSSFFGGLHIKHSQVLKGLVQSCFHLPYPWNKKEPITQSNQLQGVNSSKATTFFCSYRGAFWNSLLNKDKRALGWHNRQHRWQHRKRSRQGQWQLQSQLKRTKRGKIAKIPFSALFPKRLHSLV